MVIIKTPLRGDYKGEGRIEERRLAKIRDEKQERRWEGKHIKEGKAIHRESYGILRLGCQSNI